MLNRFHITGNKEEGVVLRLFREANKASAKLEVEASRPLWRPWRLVPIDSDSEVEASDVVSMMVSMTYFFPNKILIESKD